jgi:hypothetical protein
MPAAGSEEAMAVTEDEATKWAAETATDLTRKHAGAMSLAVSTEQIVARLCPGALGLLLRQRERWKMSPLWPQDSSTRGRWVREPPPRAYEGTSL